MVKQTQTIRRQKPTNCLSLFDHYVRLTLKGLIYINWESASLNFHRLLPHFPQYRSSAGIAHRILHQFSLRTINKAARNLHSHFILTVHHVDIWLKVTAEETI